MKTIETEDKIRPEIIQETWVVISAFNEEESIGEVLSKLAEKGYHIIIVDDCSTDQTSKVALDFPVTLLKHLVNLGQGAAIQTGFDYILKHTDAKYIITFDADGQHDVDDIPGLLLPLATGKSDVALGSRFLRSTTGSGMPKSKMITLQLGLIFTRISTGLKLTDTHNGLRGMKRDVLNKIKIEQNRMAHASEILTQIAQHKIRYCEVPVTIRYTPYSKKKGQSIFNSLNILWDLFIGKK